MNENSKPLRRRCSWAIGAAGFFLAVTLAACRVAAETPSGEVWIVDTRCAPYGGPDRVREGRLDFRRRDASGRWNDVDEATFRKALGSGVPAAVFIHGNLVDPCTALHEGLGLRRALRCAAGDRPWRLVIWSWPSSRLQGRLRHDVQVKAARSDAQAYYLARCLDGLGDRARVGLIGHSFGARIITGAMEMLAGGQVAGYGLEKPGRPPRAIRTVLVAAAVDNGWLLPGRRNGAALGVLDRMLVTCNPRDRVLRWYPRMYGRGGPQALGCTGPVCLSLLGGLGEKIETLGTHCSVGRAHGWDHYLHAGPFLHRLPRYVFLEDDPAE